MIKISRRKINKIRALHKLGYSVRKIADELKCSPTTVQKYNPQDRMPLSNLFLGENLKQKIHVSKPRQPNREPYYIQPAQYPRVVEDPGRYYPVIEDPWRSREQHLEEVEYLRRREEDQRIEQNKKSDQETQEKMHQLEMEFYSTKQQENKRKNLNITNKLIRMSDESYKKFDADIQEVKEEWLKKLQEDQQVVDSTPRLVKVKLKKAQEDEPRKSENQHKPIPITLKQVEENETTGSNHSEIIAGIALSAISGLCEGIDSYRPPDRKPKRVNLIIKR